MGLTGLGIHGFKIRVLWLGIYKVWGLEGLGFNSGLRIRVLPVGVAGSGFRVPSGSAMGVLRSGVWGSGFRVSSLLESRNPFPTRHQNSES